MIFPDELPIAAERIAGLQTQLAAVTAERDALKAELSRQVDDQLDTLPANSVGAIDAEWLKSVGFTFVDGMPLCRCGVLRFWNGQWELISGHQIPTPTSRSDVITLMRLLGCGKETI